MIRQVIIICVLLLWTISSICGKMTEESKSRKAKEHVGKNNGRIRSQNKIRLRNSTFPFIPPYIRFCASAETCTKFDIDETNQIYKNKRPIWKYSRKTTRHVVDVVRSSGFRLLKKTDDWIGQYLVKEQLPVKRVLKYNQKINKLPVTFLGRKDLLAKKLNMFSQKHGSENFGFIPETFVLPEDVQELKRTWSRDKTKTPWIIKPSNGCCGEGVEVVNDWDKIPSGVPIIVQKYIANPLLVDEKKVDIRVDVLVTGLNPLKIYMYDDYAIRRAVLNYTSDPRSHADGFMHVNNIHVQKHSTLYKNSEKCTKEMVWHHIKNLGGDAQKIDDEIQDMIIKTMISAEDYSSSEPYGLSNNPYNAYTLLGFDFIVDEQMKPWLLEINIAPAQVFMRSKLVVEEMLNIVGYHVWDDTTEIFSNNAVSISDKCDLKHKLFEDVFYDSGKNTSKILETLTMDDIMHLIAAIDEKREAKVFRRIFPKSSSQKYFNFFEKPRYYNLLLTAWEYTYSGKEKEGIEMIMRNMKKFI